MRRLTRLPDRWEKNIAVGVVLLLWFFVGWFFFMEILAPHLWK